jgi:hypothetical protein
MSTKEFDPCRAIDTSTVRRYSSHQKKLFESFIDLFESFIDLFESFIDLNDAVIVCADSAAAI